jgi:hypothetical protein
MVVQSGSPQARSAAARAAATTDFARRFDLCQLQPQVVDSTAATDVARLGIERRRGYGEEKEVRCS